MSLLTQLQEEQKKAMKQKDSETLQTIRGAIAAIKTQQIDSDHELTDQEMQKIVTTQCKQLKDALGDFQKANREDLIQKTEQELVVLEAFLPKQLSDQEVEDIVDEVIAKVGKENFGQLMGAVMKEIAGRADGGRVRNIIENKVK